MSRSNSASAGRTPRCHRGPIESRAHRPYLLMIHQVVLRGVTAAPLKAGAPGVGTPRPHPVVLRGVTAAPLKANEVGCPLGGDLRRTPRCHRGPIESG